MWRLPNEASWHSAVFYRTASGTLGIVHELSEFADLHDLVERGPHWDTIEKIEIVRINHVTDVALTVEQAEAL
jgi:hypothetical protein